MRYFQITAPDFCAGVGVNEAGYIWDTAPILNWAKGEHIDAFRHNFQAWKIDELTKEDKMTQQITVGAVTKQSKIFNNETMWGVKVGDSWMDLHVVNKPAKGQSLTVETWEVEGTNGRKFVHARPVQASQPAQAPSASSQPAQAARPLNNNRATPYTQTFDAYASMARQAHALAMELEPAPGAERARFGFVSTFLIAFCDGKIVLDATDAWEDLVPPLNEPVRHEKTAAHIHLEKVIWDYCERIGQTPAEAFAMFKEVSGKKDMSELSEKEAIQARLKAEAIIDAATDYKALFTNEAMKLASKEGWELTSKAPADLKKKQALLFKAGITKSFKDLTNLEAKAALERITDDITH